MKAGKIFSAQKWQYGLSTQASVTGSGTNCTLTGQFITTLANSYETAPFSESVGIEIEIVQTYGSSPSTSYDVSIPTASVSFGNTFGSFIASATLVLEFDNLECYVIPATTNSQGKSLGGSTPCFEVVYTGGTVTWQGSSVGAFGAGSFKGVGLAPPFLIPAMVPILGIGPVLNPVATGGLTVTNTSLPWSGSVSANLTATGGYQWQDSGGTWHTPLLSILPPIIPVVTGNLFGTMPAGFNPAFGTNTWNAGLSVYQTTTTESYTQPPGEPTYLARESHTIEVTANLQIVPNLPRAIKRAQPGYNALWVRTGMPQTTGLGIAGWGYNVTSTDSSLLVNESDSVNLTTIIHPDQSQDLAGVRDAPDPIEDTLGFPFYCPMSCAYQEGYFENTPDNVAAHSPPDTLTETTWSVSELWNFPNTINSSNPAVDGYYVHGDPLVTYWNLWGNPHWSYNLWYPGTPSVGLQSTWLVDGGASNRHYWQQIRDQYNYDLALPPAQQTNTRTSNMLSSITETDLAAAVAQFWNGNPWIGACRFQVDKPAIPVNVSVDVSSSAAWSVTDGSILVT